MSALTTAEPGLGQVTPKELSTAQHKDPSAPSRRYEQRPATTRSRGLGKRGPSSAAGLVGVGGNGAVG